MSMETEVNLDIAEDSDIQVDARDFAPVAHRRASAVGILERTVVLSLPARRLKPTWMSRNGEVSVISVIDSFRDHLLSGTGWFFSEDILDDEKLVLDLFAGLEATIAGPEYDDAESGVRQRCNEAYKVLYKAKMKKDVPPVAPAPKVTTHFNSLLSEQGDVLDIGWKQEGNCLGIDPDFFFPERGASTKEPREVCKGCVVRTDCLEYALASGEKFGIWGGKSERERRRIRKKRNETKKAAETKN